jgi:hypothetical protein
MITFKNSLVISILLVLLSSCYDTVYEHEEQYPFPSQGIAVVKKDGKYGAISFDDARVIKVPIIYEENLYFSDTPNIVSWGLLEDRWGLIDANGNTLIPHQYQSIDIVYIRPNDYSIVEKEGLKGVVNIAKHKEIIAPKFKLIKKHSYNEESTAFLCKDVHNKWLIFDHSGVNFLPDIQIDSIATLTNTGSKLALLSQNKWLFFDLLSKKILLETTSPHFFWSKYNNYVALKENNQWGMVSLDSVTVLPFEYDSLYINPLYPKAILAQKSEFWGILDMDANVQHLLEFDSIVPSKNNWNLFQNNQVKEQYPY